MEALPWGLTMEMEVLDSTSFSLTYPTYEGADQIDHTDRMLSTNHLRLLMGVQSKRNEQNFDWFMSTGSPNLIVKLNSTDGLISHQAKLNVQTARHGSSILTLTIEEKVKQKGGCFNKLLEVYIENSIELKNKLTSNSLRFIDAQLEVVSKGVADIEGEMETFRTQEGVTDLSAEVSFFLSKLVDTTNRSVIRHPDKFHRLLETYIIRWILRIAVHLVWVSTIRFSLS